MLPGHSRPFLNNTEKLELPSISQVHTRGPVDVPWYNSHYSQRPILSGDRLPNLHLPQSYTSTPPYGSSSSRSGLSDSSLNGNGSHYPSSQTSTSSYPSANSGIGLKTPSPSPTSQNIGAHSPGLPEDPVEHPVYSSQPQGIQPYTQVTEPYSIAMNQPQQYMDSHQSHMSAGQSYAPQPTTAGGMSHYPQYQQQPPVLQTGPGGYAPPPSSYGQYSYSNGVASPQGGNHPVSSSISSQMNAMLPLPGTCRVYSEDQIPKLILIAMPQGGPQNGYGGVPGGIQGYPPQNYDTTGQVAPPGMKPRVTATLWEDEGSMCFQVEAKGVCVARRDGTDHCMQPRWRDVLPHDPSPTEQRLTIYRR